MSDDPPQFYNTTEQECDECGSTCEHHVRIEVITENDNYGGNQPYRITECQLCGHVVQERVGAGN